MKRKANKIISLILALSLMLSMFTVNMFISADTEPVIWDGTTVTAPADSDGDGVYEITNAAEFAYIIKTGGAGGSYKLTADIYLNDINKMNWQTGEAESGYSPRVWYGDWQVTAFNGTLDGAGHTVNGLYYEKEASKEYTLYYGGVALMPKVYNATIKNLCVDNSYIHHEASVSAFVAVANEDEGVTIDNCYAGANVYLKGCAVAAFYAYSRNAGGFNLSNSYSLANLSSNGGGYSGLAAFIWERSGKKVNITGCYNAKGCISNHEVATTINAKSCYQTDNGNGYVAGATTLTEAQMQGADALTNMSALNNYGNYYVTTDTYPALSVFKGIKVTKIWDGSVAQPEDSNLDGVYEITSGEELAYIISTGGAAGAKYQLTNDIYLNNLDKINWETGVAASDYTPNSWYDNTPFQGSIQGDGHVVYGLYFNNPGTPSWSLWGNGLIPKVAVNSTVTVTELGVDYAYISSKHGVSAFVGLGGENTSTTEDIRAKINIDQCYVGANVTLIGYDVGAFRGATRGSKTTVTNSYSLANIQGTMSGIVGGETWDATVSLSNVFAANAKPTSEAWSSSYTLKNVYVTDAGNYPNEVVTLTTDNMQGTDALSNEAKMPALNSQEKFVSNEGYPSLVAFLGYDINVGDEVWDKTTVAPADKDGDGVYEIGTAEELAYIISTDGAEGANYKLTADIYLNATDYINWETGEAVRGYIPRVWNYNNIPFQGNIDGDGHTVYGLYYEETGATGWGYRGIGLVPRVNDGASVKITNLAVDKAYLASVNGVSAFVGVAGPTGHNTESVFANVLIENCYAGKDVTLKGHHVGVFRGGSYRSNTTVKNSYSLASTICLSEAEGAAGLFGNEWSSNITLKNVFNANGGAGGQDTYLTGKSFSGVYVTSGLAGNGVAYSTDVLTVLTANKMQGRDALINTQKLYKLNSDNAFEATNGYPILVAFIKEAAGEGEADTIKIWNGTDVEPTNTDANGNILITSAEELAYIIENGGNANATYKLTTNIYLNDVNRVNWTTGKPIGDYVPNSWYENSAFQGTIDGDGYIVYGLYSNIPNAEYAWGYWGQGLVPRVDSGTTATIKNLGVDKAYINATNAGGAFVGFVGTRNSDAYTEKANVNIEQCFAGEKVSINAHAAGAFVGAGRGAVIDVKNSYSLAEINSRENGGCAVDFAPSGFVGNDWEVDFTVNGSYNAKGTLQGWWDGTTSSNSGSNYATGYDIDKTASGGALEAYYAVKLDAANMQGLDALISAEKMWKLGATGAYTPTKGFPELTIFIQKGNSNAFRIWDGTTMVPTNGSGSEADPYLINYASELAYIISSGGAADAYYKLTADIYLNNIHMIDWATGEAADGYIPNAWYENTPFQGNIDGNGHTVYGIYYDDNTGKNFENLPENVSEPGFGYYYNSALVPRVNDGTAVSIKNLAVDNTFIHACQGASAFVGFAGATGNYSPEVKAQVVIDNCYAGAKVYLEGGNTGVFRAGERGSNTVVTNSYSLANTVGVKFNGLIGNYWSATVSLSNVYNANGAVATDPAASATLSNVYATDNTGLSTGVTLLTKEQMFGETALDNMSALSTDTFTAIPDYYPVLDKFAQNKLVKNNRVYYGVALGDALDFYATESGEQYFWRYDDILINDDSSMDISDLVLITLQSNAGTVKADIDRDGNSTTDDIKILRKALIGKNDYVYTPLHSMGNYTPYSDNISSEYQFVWGDEFDGNTLDTQKWGIHAKMNSSSGEHEGEFILSKDEDAVGVEDGNLRLTAYKSNDGVYVAPASVVTQNTMNFKYGYVEIRAKFPVQDGVWSSWWTKSVFDGSDTNNLVPSSTEVGAEIDMIEVFDTNQATFNIIKWWPTEDGKFEDWYPNDAKNAYKQTITNDRYYVFGYEWTEDDKIRMYCDGVLYGEYDVSAAYTEKVTGRNMYIDESGTDMECFDAHQFLIFNNHLFYPTVSDAGMFIYENTDFTQADYLIDYCRVYQKPGVGDIVTK